MALTGKTDAWVGKRVVQDSGLSGPGVVRWVMGGWVNVKYDRGYDLNHRGPKFLRYFSPAPETPSPSTPKTGEEAPADA